MLEMCDMIDDPEYPKCGKHRETSQIKKSESAVKKIIEAIPHFTNCGHALQELAKKNLGLLLQKK